MHHFCSICLRFSLALVTIVVLTGCGAKSFDYHPVSEIPKSPALFNEEKDGMVVFDSEKRKAEKDSSESQNTGDQEARSQTGQSSVDEKTLQDYKEFQEYQEWKEWKKSKGNSDEFKNFQDWREWKSYQEWKKNEPNE